jgi:hypothetical protein
VQAVRSWGRVAPFVFDLTSGDTMTSPAATPQKQRFIDRYLAWFVRWMPDSFVICLALTLLVAVLAAIFTDTPVWSGDEETVSLVGAWTGAFWNLLEFTMQMVVLLATGTAVATSPPAKRVLARLAGLPRNRAQVIILGSVVAGGLGFIHWGLGMMGGIVLGKELLVQAKRNGIKIHAPVLVAALFTALVPGAAGNTRLPAQSGAGIARRADARVRAAHGHRGAPGLRPAAPGVHDHRHHVHAPHAPQGRRTDDGRRAGGPRGRRRVREGHGPP